MYTGRLVVLRAAAAVCSASFAEPQNINARLNTEIAKGLGAA